MPGDKLLNTRPADGVALLTLNRPRLMNAIDMELYAALAAAFDDLENADDVRAIVITGTGDRAFSAGFDIEEMAGFDAEAMAQAFQKRDRLFWRVAGHPKPIVAALNGVTYGAGALIAAAADLRLGCPATKFKVTASSYGAANATWSLPRVVGFPKAKEILLTGRALEADEALEIGLLNQLVRDRPAVDAAVEMAVMIAANPPQGTQGVKALINQAIGRSLQAGYEAEYAWMIENMGAQAISGAEMFSGFLAGRGTGRG